MGYWNKTCALTELPIFCGENTVTFLLIQKLPVESHNCYSNGYWEFVPLPIYGKYNDYGWIDADDSQEWKLKLLQDTYGESLVRKIPRNEYKDSDFCRYPDLFDTPFDTFDNLGDSIHGSIFAIKLNGAYQHEGLLSAITINRKSFEEMTESISEEYGEACYTRDELTELLGEYMALVESEKQALHAIEMGSDKDDGEIRKLLLELQLKLELINNTDSYVTKLLRKRCCGSDIDTWNHPLTWIVGFLSSSSSSSDRGYITGAFVRNNDLMTNPNITTKELMDSYMLLYVFDSLRKQFVPTGHEGSQAGITEVNKRFAEVYQKRIDEYYEEYGEEED